MQAPSPDPDQALLALLARYRPLPGVADELLDPGGRIRPVWRDFIHFVAALGPDDLSRRFRRGDQYLRDAGVFFRQYGDGSSVERSWPLSHIPVLISETDWTAIADGLRQRADLLEDLAADLYGPNRLVAAGHLPAGLIAASREWLRPLVGVTPRGGHFLHFLAFEIGRGPDGSWWVLGDRTQAPSGAGFALENRVASARVFSDIYAEARVHRLAGFFGMFRDALTELAGIREDGVGILTPGPLNDTYFEHAYIARYLGISLLEGEDLTVEDGRVLVRTIEGNRPISVLWRRLDSAFADPLELDPSSRLGTPGLIGAVRGGAVTMVNALGTGVLETRALMAFLPRIAREIGSGAPLALPNIATWWCGQASERAHVLANRDTMMIGPARATGLPFEIDDATMLGGAVRGPAGDSFDSWLAAEGADLVGQESVMLSTTPAMENGQLVARPMSLRVFLARTSRGWQVMPGGFARIGSSEDAAAIAMQRGGAAADVWVVSDRPVDTSSTLEITSEDFDRPRPGVLPARAGENLFWLGRYAERAESIMRLVRAYHIRLAETGDAGAPLTAYLRGYLDRIGIDVAAPVPTALTDTLTASLTSAGHVRDRFSTDGWTVLDELAREAARERSDLTAGDATARAMGDLLRQITGFSGLVQENMYRFTGWRLLSIGRALERAIQSTSALAELADPDAPEGALDLAVEIGDSVMSHRRRYSVATGRATVVDLLALDSMNPRAVVFQLAEIQTHVRFLPVSEAHAPLSELERAVMRTHTGLAVQTPDGLDTMLLQAARAEIEALSDLLAKACFT